MLISLEIFWEHTFDQYSSRLETWNHFGWNAISRVRQTQLMYVLMVRERFLVFTFQLKNISCNALIDNFTNKRGNSRSSISSIQCSSVGFLSSLTVMWHWWWYTIRSIDQNRNGNQQKKKLTHDTTSNQKNVISSQWNFESTAPYQLPLVAFFFVGYFKRVDINFGDQRGRSTKKTVTIWCWKEKPEEGNNKNNYYRWITSVNANQMKHNNGYWNKMVKRV